MGTLTLYINEICMSKVLREIKDIYKVALFVKSKVSKVLYIHMNRMLTVAFLSSNSNYGNVQFKEIIQNNSK